MKIIIYGAGHNCSFVMKRIAEEDAIICIADCDCKKQGTVIDGIKVISPEEIPNYEYDMILVSVVNGWDKIVAFLREIGIDSKKIVSWYTYVNLSKHSIGTYSLDWENNVTADKLWERLCSENKNLSEIEEFFLRGEHRPSTKWLHYFEVYNRHFSKFYGKDITVVEVGVRKGGSLDIWKHMFGENARIFGIDIDPECKKYEDGPITIFIGDQGNREFWKEIKPVIGKVDIFIDDGGHFMEQQIVTFEEMYDSIQEDGVYLCEDIGTSYDPEVYDSGYKKEGTFVEYSKNFIDYIHAWYSKELQFQINHYTKTIHSLHYYYGAFVIEKQAMAAPIDMEICNMKEEHFAIPTFRGEL
jgi:hypothetical protein